MVHAARFLDELLLHPDLPAIKVKIADGQAAELADPHPGSQQYIKLIIVTAVVGILPDKVHEGFLLLRGQGNPFLGIVDHHTAQRKVEGILSDDILVAGHLESGLDNAPDTGDGAVSSAITLELHEPQLGIRGADGVDGAIAEVLFLCDLQYEVVADFGCMADALLQGNVAFQQFDDGDISFTVFDAVIHILLNRLFLFPQFLQIICVDSSSLARYIGVTELIGKVFALAFSRSKDTALVVFSFFGHCQTPFRKVRSLDMTQTLYHIKAHKSIATLD